MVVNIQKCQNMALSQIYFTFLGTQKDYISQPSLQQGENMWPSSSQRNMYVDGVYHF